jgi:hypothetical protein
MRREAVAFGRRLSCSGGATEHSFAEQSGEQTERNQAELGQTEAKQCGLEQLSSPRSDVLGAGRSQVQMPVSPTI